VAREAGVNEKRSEPPSVPVSPIMVSVRSPPSSGVAGEYDTEVTLFAWAAIVSTVV
jgi:hypothetical protein